MGIRYTKGEVTFVSGVVSFNTRTGAVTLLFSDIINALGYTPADETLYLPLTAGTTKALSDLLQIDKINGNQIVLQSSGAQLGFIRNPSANKWSLGFGNNPNSGGTDVLRWGNLLVEILANLEVTGDIKAALQPYVSGSSLPVIYNSTNDRFETGIVGNVVSFNTRTGAVVLLSADVISALGFTPLANPMTTKGDIIKADTGGAPIRMGLGTPTAFLSANNAGNDLIYRNISAVNGIGLNFGVSDLSIQVNRDGDYVATSYTVQKTIFSRQFNGADWVVEVGAVMEVTAITGTIRVEVSYTDLNNNARVMALFPVGSVTADVNATNAYCYPTVTLRAKGGIPIIIRTIVTGTVAYNASGYVTGIN